MRAAARLDHPEGERRWVTDRRWDAVATPTTEAVLTAYDHLLVVAAHPDDECLGAGAFLADAASLGVDVTVLEDERCIQMMSDFVEAHPELWLEDIGE